MKRHAEFRRTLIGLFLIIAGVLSLASALRGWVGPQASAGNLASDVPQFQNARLEVQKMQGPLNEPIRHWASASAKPRWLGYAVETVGGQHEICCSNSNGNSDNYCAACALEGHSPAIRTHSTTAPRETVRLEGGREMAVMLRAENGKINKVREFSTNCPADAGGLEVLWLDAVPAGESIAFLEKLVSSNRSADEDESVAKDALVALALHADAAADRALESFVAPQQTEWLREQTAFWLGVARGAEGFRLLQNIAQRETSTAVREKVAFALSLSNQPSALTEMIRMAHEDQSPQVRGQALFWLAQKAGKKAEAAITGAIQDDPDTDVKKKAVFALSQMPKDEGIPRLIEVAQNNKNPEVRKQAMFWLGQSQDPRALAFFEKILTQ
jgi:hypothetical protein